MSEDQKKLLEQQLWNIANTLRGKMGADEFRDYILGFIFYKYLSEKMNLYADKILKEDGILYINIDEKSKKGKQYLDAIKEEALLKLGYFLKPSELFSQVAERGNGDGEKEDGKSNFILEDLGNILRNIEASTMGTDSEDDFDNLFEDLDLTSTKLGRTEGDKNALIAKVLSHLDKINFQLNDAKGDVLGDAYEYLIAQFASGAGKKAGEFYTPQQVSMVLAKLVTTGKQKLKTAYDPTCGSGSLLLRVAKEVKEVGKFYGQELNRTTYNLARMNMILHGVHYQKFDIRQEDTLEKPQHLDKRFEAIVANPPFSAQWSASSLFLTDDRFSQYGRLAPSGKADFAFIQHMIHQLAENGTMAVVAPHGVLFRGGAEGHIRRYLIENRNYLDAVIGLPANIFYGTSIPTCILVFKKCRETPENILFIDASQGFEKEGNQNYLRDEHIDKIIDTYRNRIVEEKYSHLADLKEVAGNDYNLNIPRYVDTFEKEDSIDLKKVAAELKALDKEIQKTDKTIADFCKELGIATPF
jgi:type I restriction enzyme M protein